MNRRLLWIVLIVVAVITLVWPLIPVPTAAMRLATIPTSGADFQAMPLDMSEVDKAFLGDAGAVQYLIALRGGGRLVLTVIDGTRNRHAVHDPSYCFSGAGWQVRERHAVKVPSGEGTWVSLAKDNQRAEALWFFDDGHGQFTSPIEYWYKTSARRVTLGASGNEPVLVSLRSLPDQSVDWARVRQILLPALGFR